MDDTYKDVTLHAVKNTDTGMLEFYGEVEGAMIPLVQTKIGHAEAAIAATADGKIAGPPGSKPKTSNK